MSLGMGFPDPSQGGKKTQLKAGKPTPRKLQTPPKTRFIWCFKGSFKGSFKDTIRVSRLGCECPCASTVYTVPIWIR